MNADLYNTPFIACMEQKLSRLFPKLPTNNQILVKREKSGCPGSNATPYAVEFRLLSAPNTVSSDAQSSKVGKTKKSEPAISIGCPRSRFNWSLV